MRCGLAVDGPASYKLMDEVESVGKPERRG